MSDRVDVAILGAGIAGLSTAFRLARAGRSVVVLDAGEPFRGGSGVNAGTLALQNKALPLILFFKAALEEWRRLMDEAEADIGYVRRGGLRVAESDDDVRALRSEREGQIALGIETEWLEGNVLRGRAPWLGPTVVAATYCEGDGFASPLLAGHALARSVSRAGVRIESGRPITSSTALADGWRLGTPTGPVDCAQVVIACGAWSRRVGALFGIDIPVECHVNMLSVTERIAQFMDNMVVTHIAGRLTLKQYPNGSCLLGGGWRGQGGVETGIKELDLDQLLGNLTLHAAIVPHLATATILRSWAGFEAETPDHWSISGAAPGRANLFLAIPAKAGFTSGALVGRLTAERVLSGRMPEAARLMAPDRFAS